MRVVAKSAHEKTDQLFIYTFESPALGQRTIVANLTNTYEVGDIAGVALEGTWLPGVEIKARKVFGVHSEGMAMGRVEAEVDSDLTGHFDADQEPHTFTVTMTVQVEARYPEDASELAAKAIAKGRGVVTGVKAD